MMDLFPEIIDQVCSYLSPNELLQFSLTCQDLNQYGTRFLQKSKSILKTYNEIFSDLIRLRNDCDPNDHWLIDVLFNIPQGKTINISWDLIKISLPLTMNQVRNKLHASLRIIDKMFIFRFVMEKVVKIVDLSHTTQPKLLSNQHKQFYFPLDYINDGFLIHLNGSHIHGHHIYNNFVYLHITKWCNGELICSKNIHHPPSLMNVHQISIECLNTSNNKHILMYDFLNNDNNLNCDGYAYILDLQRMKIYYFNFLPLLTEMRYSQQVLAQCSTPFWLKFENSIFDENKFFIVSSEYIFEVKIVDTDKDWGECYLSRVRSWYPIDDDFYDFCPLKEDIVCLNNLVNLHCKTN